MYCKKAGYNGGRFGSRGVIKERRSLKQEERKEVKRNAATAKINNL